MADGTLDRFAREAIDGLERATTRTPPSERGAFALADGYAVASLVDRALTRRGWRHVGRKLAFTDRAAWPKLGADGPAWGYVYDRSTRELRGDDGSFPLEHRVAPRLETEIVVGLRRAPAPSATSRDVAACLAWAALGFELIDCHYPGWRFTPADALADLVFHAALLVGERCAFASEAEAVAWGEALRRATVTVRRPDLPPVHGSPSAVLGDPLAAVGALAALRDERGAMALRAEELVTTGTMTAPFEVHSGDDVAAEITELGLAPLRVRFG